MTYHLALDIVLIHHHTKILYIKYFNHESAERQTHWNNFIPSTADVGGKKETLVEYLYDILY